jgi:hypothetical protein
LEVIGTAQIARVDAEIDCSEWKARFGELFAFYDLNECAWLTGLFASPGVATKAK